MADSTRAPRSDIGKKKVAKPIYVGDARNNERMEANKNIVLSYSVHPALANAIYDKVASDPLNVTATADTIILKRINLTQYMRQVTANAVDYAGDLTLARGGASGVSPLAMFRTTVSDMFAMARAFGAVGNQPEDQIRALAFSQARQAVTANALLTNVEVSDDVLERLWSGAPGELDIEDDDEDDEDDTEE